MTLNVSAIVALHGACALVYALLSALILMRPPLSRTGAWLAFACLATAVWAATFAFAWHAPVGRLAAWLEIGRSAAWYGFILHLYRRSIGSSRQTANAFKTIGVLALLMLGSTPLIEWFVRPFCSQPAVCRHRDQARVRHLQRAAAGKPVFQYADGISLAYQSALRRPGADFPIRSAALRRRRAVPPPVVRPGRRRAPRHHL